MGDDEVEDAEKDVDEEEEEEEAVEENEEEEEQEEGPGVAATLTSTCSGEVRDVEDAVVVAVAGPVKGDRLKRSAAPKQDTGREAVLPSTPPSFPSPSSSLLSPLALLEMLARGAVLSSTPAATVALPLLEMLARGAVLSKPAATVALGVFSTADSAGPAAATRVALPAKAAPASVAPAEAAAELLSLPENTLIGARPSPVPLLAAFADRHTLASFNLTPVSAKQSLFIRSPLSCLGGTLDLIAVDSPFLRDDCLADAESERLSAEVFECAC